MGFLATVGLGWWVFSASQQEEQTGFASPASLEDTALPVSKLPVETVPLVEIEPKAEVVPQVETEPENEARSDSDPELEAPERQLQNAIDTNPKDVDTITELAIFMRKVNLFPAPGSASIGNISHPL